MMTGYKPQIASEQSTHKESLPSPSYNPVDYDSLKSYLEDSANKPAADDIYYIEVTELTDDKLKRSLWNVPSPLGQILKVSLHEIEGNLFYGCENLTVITIAPTN